MYEDENVGIAVDDRISLMQQYVDLDNARKQMDKERKFLEDKSQKLANEFRQVSERLRILLGFEDSMDEVKRAFRGEDVR